MKYILTLLFFINLAFAQDIKIPNITARGLDNFKDMNFSAYLVSAKSTALSKKKVINAVITKIHSRLITNPDLVIKEMNFSRRIARSFAANYVLFVVHEQKDFVINKNFATPAFEAAMYLNKDQKIAPLPANRKYKKQLLIPLKELQVSPSAVVPF